MRKRNKEGLQCPFPLGKEELADKFMDRGLRKLLVTAAALVLLGILYYMIFHFSAQDAEVSGSLSQMISRKCVETVNFLAGGRWDEAELAGMAEAIEHPVRKLAHFSEYGCMGVLVYILWSQWMRQGRRLRLLTVLWVFLSAASDEFHQYFVPGRCASAADVALDTCGGVCGMLFCICISLLYQRRRERMAGRRRKE